MLIDLHAHTSGISKCCRIPFEQVIKTTLKTGMDGIVLTNHYQKSYMNDEPSDQFAERYISEFYAAEEYGRKNGCRVFFGIEVTMELYPNVHILLYGLEPEFLMKHPHLFDYSQKELYELVKAANGIMIQAHPFRNGTTVLDTAFLDGIEINCHPLYKKSFWEEILCIARENNITVSCGGDYHADTYRPKCGMFLPDHMENNGDLSAFFMSKKEKKLLIQEPNNDDFFIVDVK